MSGFPPLFRRALPLAAATLAAAAALACMNVLAAPPGASASAPGSQPRPAAKADAGGPRWNDLTPAQRQVLAPLAGDWNSIDDRGKERWLGVAGRFHKLPPEEQQRATQRMVEWSHMTPQQRTQARLNFQETRDVPKAERQARWEQYQALSEDQKRELAKRATAAGTPASAASGAGPNAHPKHSTPVGVVQPKSNVVSPVKDSRTPVEPGSVAVEVRPGATTTLLTRHPTPPAHQHDGGPKIAADSTHVDRTTLLPKRGPQAAGGASKPAPKTQP
jgi:hypothetical protein